MRVHKGVFENVFNSRPFSRYRNWFRDVSRFYQRVRTYNAHVQRSKCNNIVIRTMCCYVSGTSDLALNYTDRHSRLRAKCNSEPFGMRSSF